MKEKIIKLIPKLAAIGLIVLIAFSVYILNRSVLFGPDDYAYSYVMGTKDKVNTIKTMVAQGKYFYNNWTGRVLPHIAIGYFRSFQTNDLFEIVNTIVFMIFVISVSILTRVRRGTLRFKNITYLTLIMTFGYFAYSKMFGEKFAWMSGACNYLWPSCLMIFFLTELNVYRIEKEEFYKTNKQTKQSIIRIALTIILAFLCGVVHENVAFVTGSYIIMLYSYLMYRIKKQDKEKSFKDVIKQLLTSNKMLHIITIIFGIGAMINIFAPGNFLRMDRENHSFNFSFLNNYVENIIPILAMILSIVINRILVKKLNKEDDSLAWTIMLYIVPALIATMPMALIGYFPPRAFLAYETLFAVVLADNTYKIFENIKELKISDKKKIIIAPIFSIVIGLVVFGRFSPSTLADINYLIPYKDMVYEEYYRNAILANHDVLVPEFKYMQWIHKDDEINISNFFPELNYRMPTNATIAQYYGFDRVTAIDSDSVLVEIKMDNEDPHTFKVNDEAGNNIYWFEYTDEVRFTVKKNQIGNWKLDLSKDSLKNKIESIRVRDLDKEYIENEDYKLDDFILK